MRIRVLDAARDDLIAGFDFYEAREQGVGDHFLACLYSDVESLKIFGGIHRRVYKNLYRSLSKRFRSPFITPPRMMLSSSARFSIAGVTHHGFDPGSETPE